ncbi:20674_t:CDS:2 [Cetraspora pellucida]|uniref:20674_t:CDS:1 n=1 Tax=Cetraspora pellucida TaxID=1433469 RepID=A0A9N9C7Q4_9GLOM|nr:20674_t:CDS:2 [Cetraspora pellucida]
MATVARDLTSIALLIAEISNYSGQIPPDEYKMAGKYTNIPAQYPVGTNIDTPARFIVWLCYKYQTETVGIQQVATQKLAQEKFLLFDNPESYEARIHPLLLGVADGDANILGLLKGHLSGKLYTWMKITNPDGIDAFFTELKNMWLECPPNLYKGSIPDQISQTSAVNIQNKSYSDSSSISRAELDSMIKSQLALVPTTSIQSSQLQKTQALQSQQKQPNFSDYLRVPDKYMPERPPDKYGVNSEKFIHCDLINPTPSASQIIESLANDLYKKVSDMFSAKPVQSKKNIEVDSDEELADRMVKLSINKTLLKEPDTILASVLERNLRIPRDLVSIKKVSKSHKIDKEPKSHKRGGSKQTVLEQIICKIIQSELKDILLSLLQELNFNNKKSYHIQNNNYQELALEISNSVEDKTLDDPMEIDFVCQKEADTGIATIPCKIKCLKISAMILDNRAETEIVTEDIVKRINRKIDRSVKYDLSGIATVPIESIGIIRNLPITLTPDCTIYEDFVVVKHFKPMLIFSNRLLKKYKCVIDWNNDKMKIHHNGKDHIFPVTMHKVKNKLKVNYATATQDGSHNEDTITSKPLVSDQILQEVDSDKDDSIPLEEWHAPAGFSSDSVDSSLKKMHEL